MTWRDSLQRVTLADGRRMIGASFRGVPFFVESSERSGGRRAVVHEFPFRDEPFVEDLGRRARTFRVDGYVVGDGYVVERDRLLSALEDTAGPGELVHPYHGVRVVVATAVSTRESARDGGFAALAIEFVETPAQLATPTTITDYPERISTAADAANVASRAALDADFSSVGVPSARLSTIADALTTATEAMDDALAPLVKATEDAAALDKEISAIVADMNALTSAPGDAIDAFLDALEGVRDTLVDAGGDLRELYAALMEIAETDFDTAIPETTSARQLERANLDAVLVALRAAFTIEAARVIPLVAYDTWDDAILDRDAVLAALDALAGDASDDLFPYLQDLRAQVFDGVPLDDDLARVITIERPVAVPSLLLSYQLYGTTDEEADIVARNGVQHPGFVSGSLSVRSNV